MDVRGGLCVMLPPGRYIKLRDPIVKEDDVKESFFHAEAKVLVKISNLRDTAIVAAVRQYAEEHMYTDIITLDEEFVKEALSREIKRREILTQKWTEGNQNENN